MVFTLVLWCTGAVIYLSDKYNHVNRWCAICFWITSLGTLKEFLMDSLVVYLLEVIPSIPLEFYVGINSCLTAILYLGAPFCFMTLAMYFRGLDKKNSIFFRGIQIFTVFLIIGFLMCFSPLQFKKYQLSSHFFWRCMSLYNLGYGLIGSILIIVGIKSERKESVRQKKKLMVEILIPPYYWWLSTIFVVHTLNFERYMKIWKANLYLTLALFLYYLYIALREGTMGIRFHFAIYQWDSELYAMDKGTRHISHMIKNQASKINWCVDILRKKYGEMGSRELDMIEKSSDQLVQFTKKTSQFLNISVNAIEEIQLSFLLYEMREEWSLINGGIEIKIELHPDVFLVCDEMNLKELFNNLMGNSADAMNGRGEILISTGYSSLRREYEIHFIDTGQGMEKEILKEVFSPYFTTKKRGVHYGLGMVFCKSVMQAHGGRIEIKSIPGEGTEVILYFPRRRTRKLGKRRE